MGSGSTYPISNKKYPAGGGIIGDGHASRKYNVHY